MSLKIQNNFGFIVWYTSLARVVTIVNMGACSGFTRKQWFTIVSLSIVNLASSICVSIQAPFYPQEAEKKGATATEYGLVFGVYEFVAFASSPLFGKYIDTIGAKFLINAGIIVSGTSAFLFGWLDLINSHSWFIGLSFLIRIVESLGTSASCTAIFSITAAIFTDSVATTLAFVEIFYGLGFIVGPTIGGYLYELGGFGCPFWFIGGLLIFVGVFIFFFLPNVDEGVGKKRSQAQIFSVLKLCPVVLDLLAVSAATISMGYFTSTLEPHLRQFHLTPLLTGTMFIISGGTYAVTSPLVGRLCDTRVYPKKMIVLGSALVILSFMLIGPLPFVPLHTVLWVVCVGLVFHGFGVACLLISTFIDAIQSSVASGLPDDISTYGIVSGLWASAFCFGGFIGPSVAGVLYDAFGFRPGTLFVIGIHAILLITTSVYICTEKERPSKAKGYIETPKSTERRLMQLSPTLILSSEKQPLTTDTLFDVPGETEVPVKGSKRAPYGTVPHVMHGNENNME